MSPLRPGNLGLFGVPFSTTNAGTKKKGRISLKARTRKKDFSTESWSSIQLQESASQQKRKQPQKTPRILRNFAQSRIVAGEEVDMVPGMSQYGESQEFSQVGIAVENDDDLPQPMDWEQESTKSNTDFSPTTK